MTIDTYCRATEILANKKQLEEKLYQLRMSTEFSQDLMKEYESVSNKLFVLGQEFAAL